MKRILSLILAVVLSLEFLSVNVSAAEITESDIAADNANSWRYENGKPITDIYEAAPIYIAEHPDATLTGIDVSHHQGEIDWEKVKESDVDFVIIRCGFAEDKPEYDDRYWEYNVSECERLGIPYGVYLYSYATSVGDALSEADHVLRLIDGHNLSFPVYYDLEDNLIIDADLEAISTAFCNKISAAGYPVGVYASLNWWRYYLTEDCYDSWYKWVAQWNTHCEYDQEYAMWQYSCTGRVDGISTNVDMNYLIGTPKDHKGWKEKLETPALAIEADTSTGNLNLSWNEISGAEEYQIWRKTADTVYTLQQTVTETFFADNTLPKDDTYFYIVKAISGDKETGNSYFSEEKSFEYVKCSIIGHSFTLYQPNGDGTKTAKCDNCDEISVINDALYSGSLGENIVWFIDSAYVLHINGEGAIDTSVWSDHREIVERAVISEGITAIGEKVFSGFEKLTQINIPDTVTEIAEDAFEAV
ncbi:MAG: leucine-rich repeat protein, partial [Oscillospiraceae bacterium]|nr:leucine-rich repeat protein [Oscillospiraceae bacterium]